MAETATWLARLGDAETQFCLRVNRVCQRRILHGIFATVSRLGDGLFWYALMAILPVLYGIQGVSVSARMLEPRKP